ncbi:MAG: efflux RND transporter periplasmic adaptor subunit [Alphaproteobacteria bacterium]|nr:efflux RND transporter periplasmic adaptor subunit [Alphaproteobacteria bacterium]
MYIPKCSAFLAASAVSLSVLLLFSGCKEKKQAQQAPLQAVGIVKAEKKDVPFQMEVPAKITGSLEIQVRAQVSGILKSRTFSEGQFVKQGEKLFEIDPEQYEAALTRARGALAQAESEVRRTTRDYERMKKLHRAGAISQKDHDDSLSAYERAQANLKVAEGSVREAEINLGYTEVKAPISGIVRKEAQSVGNLVTANAESSLLTSMVQICPLHAVFSLPGSLWNTLAKGKLSGKVQMPKFDKFKIEVIMSDGTKYPKDGKIIFIDSTEDNLTSSVSIKAEIPSDEKQRILLPGQFVRVKIVGAEYNDAIVVPASALISTSLGHVVYVVRDDKSVEVRPVKAELVGNNGIINEGLNEGETVIFEGVSKVRPGEKVNAVTKATAPEESK